MELTGATARQELANWSDQIRDIVASRGDGVSAEEIGHAIGQFKSDRFVIAILGKAKRGKSTLLNALMGRQDDLIAPIDKLPASSAITRFSWAEREKATVIFRSGRKEEIGFDCICQYVTEEGNHKNCKEVSFVEVEGPFIGLDRDVVLVDTPGAGSIHEYHDQILHAFIPQADAVIVLVTARMPLDQDELELLQQVKKADIRKIFFAINKVDVCTDQDLDDAVAHNRQVLAQVGVTVDQIHRISALRAFHGDLAGTGVEQFMSVIATFLQQGKNAVLNERMVARVRSLAAPVQAGLETELVSIDRTAEQRATDLAKLRASKQQLELRRGIADRQFLLEWNKAVDALAADLDDICNRCKAATNDKVEAISVFGVGKLQRELVTIINASIDAELAGRTRQLDEEFSACCQHFDVARQSIRVPRPGASLSATVQESPYLLSSTVKGGALVASGLTATALGTAVAAVSTGLATFGSMIATAGGSTVASYVGLGGLSAVGGTISTGAGTIAIIAGLAGPAGILLAGMGFLAVPLAWRTSKIKVKKQLKEAAAKHIDEVFEQLHGRIIPRLRDIGNRVVEELRLRLDMEVRQVEIALENAGQQKSVDGRSTLERKSAEMATLLSSPPVAMVHVSTAS